MDSDICEWISTSEELAHLLDRVNGAPTCAIDTEADSLHRYRESLCLIQFAWDEHAVLIDPLACEDLGPLAEFLSRATVWMHGADYDMTMLRREFGVLPPRVFDTQIGARLLGVRKFGLANLVEHYFEVQLSKSSQKADWGRRPLPPKMVEYALNDVRYLLPMAERIESGLREKGRYDWFLESCEAAREKVLDRDESKEEPWRVQGAGRLDRKGLNFLRTLWNWRDREAERWDRPSFMVATNRQLVDWSQQLARGRKIEIPRHFRNERRRRFERCIERAGEVASDDYPTKARGLRRRRDGDFDERVNELMRHRNRRAGELDIEPSLIASRSVIEGLAAGEEEASQQLLGWQRDCLGIDSR